MCTQDVHVHPSKLSFSVLRITSMMGWYRFWSASRPLLYNARPKLGSRAVPTRWDKLHFHPSWLNMFNVYVNQVKASNVNQ